MSTLVETQLADENPLVEGLERLPVHPTALVIFGATGDLAHRKLLPALYNLAHEGALPERFELIGVARREKPDDEFREMAKQSIERYSRHRPDPAVLDGLLRDMRYVAGTFDEDKVYDEIDRILCDFDARAGLQHNRIYYLSTAPEFFPIIAGQIGGQRMDACEQADVRLVIEKPFGYDLESARMLNSQLLDVFDESQLYRIDHYLGKETVQNLMALRFANALFEPVWNRNYIDSVEITAAEDIGIGTRAGYYEGAGALRDLVQNHMMQLLSLLAMEPPAAFEANRLRDEKLKVLEAIVPPEIEKVASMAVRGQYAAGESGGEHVPGYRRGAGGRAGLAHRDVRGAAPARVQLALGGRPVLPAHRQAPGAQGHRDRGHAQAGPASGVSEHRLGGRAVQPDRAHRSARRGRVGVAGGEDPRRADAHPSGQP